MINIHGTLVCFNDEGILLIGNSGSGKSDLALRLIQEKGAKLVADDRVDIENIHGELYGSAPKEIAGKIEIRGLGIAHIDFVPKERITLCIELCLDRREIERMPMPDYVDFLGVSVTKIKLYPFDCSTINKIVAKISGIIS